MSLASILFENTVLKKERKVLRKTSYTKAALIAAIYLTINGLIQELEKTDPLMMKCLFSISSFSIGTGYIFFNKASGFKLPWEKFDGLCNRNITCALVIRGTLQFLG